LSEVHHEDLIVGIAGADQIQEPPDLFAHACRAWNLSYRPRCPSPPEHLPGATM
jgi:hypothetical protein